MTQNVSFSFVKFDFAASCINNSFVCVCVCVCVCLLREQAKMNVVQSLQRFLNKYGFRCINEQKLEENSLHDDPGTLHLSLLSLLLLLIIHV